MELGVRVDNSGYNELGNRLAILMVIMTASFILFDPTTTAFASSSDENTDAGWNDSCYDSGYRDGQNGPFSEGAYDHCGDQAGGDKAYYDGFIDGCMSLEGNTIDVYESATDA
jgi:hypothetical protein